jgi:3-phosphoshikimate 1-carboxyvinyltransferase
VPGDKSISHRAAIIAALADGTSQLSNFSTSQDCASTLSCLGHLGVSIEREGNNVRVVGRGARGLIAPAAPLDCGNSGSTMRMLAGVLGGQGVDSILTGDESLLLRPMKRIVAPLALMGAQIASQDGRPPLHIAGKRPMNSIRYELPVASAQVKSCVLLAGLNAAGRTEIVETLGPTRDHTERILRWFGVPVEIHTDEGAPNRIVLDGPVSFAARDVNIPGDISSAAFLIAAAALLPGSQLELEDVGLNPTRAQFLPTLAALGFDVEIADAHEDCNEPLGDLTVIGKAPRSTPSGPNIVAGSVIAQLIDELPLLAVLGTQLEGGIEIRDAAELRVKETDRIAATLHNLRAMGAEVTEHEDGLTVAGPIRLRGALIDARGDHRIAMAFTVAALLAEGESEIDGADCVAVSFPEFFELLESVVER